MWHPVTEPPRDDVPILIKGESGIKKPHDVFYVSGRYENPEGTTHRTDRWRTSDRTNIREFGWIPTHWMYASELESSLNPTPNPSEPHAQTETPGENTRQIKRTGAETLRLIVSNMNSCRESFNDRFSLDQLITVGKALLACGWNILPDTWEERQVQEALQGKPPRWNTNNEEPIYDDHRKDT